MTCSEINRKVISFRREYNLTSISFSSLYKVTEKLGYTIIQFNSLVNNENVSSIINSLDLSNHISSSRGFTYAKGDYRLVFINEDLSEKEKKIVLAHELGHIVFGHMSKSPVIGNDVSEEYEANEFAHFLLNPGMLTKTLCFIKKHFKAFLISLIVILFVAGGITTYSIVSNSKNDVEDQTYYVTSSGKKYHKKNCYYIRNKKNIRILTEEELKEGKYSPCQICFSDEE